jgi:murein DD-endopeptidase MepM/ murein hydrolase activator NlpD
VTPIDGEWSLPGPIDLIDANPQALTRPHHDYPAWDWPIPIDTPIYAMRSGTVTAIRTWPHNWFEQGCGPNDARCDTCGIGLTITDNTGTRWTYCHGTRLAVALGATITAGQQILWSGNTGRSSGPHLHLEIRTRDGQRRCPQPLLVSLHQILRALVPEPLPTAGCTF